MDFEKDLVDPLDLIDAERKMTEDERQHERLLIALADVLQVEAFVPKPRRDRRSPRSVRVSS